MNANRRILRRLQRLMVAQACALFAVSSAWAQAVATPNPATEAATPPPAAKPMTPIDWRRGIDELFESDERKAVRTRARRPLVSWRSFFLAADALIKLAERAHILPLRAKAVKRAYAVASWSATIPKVNGVAFTVLNPAR